MQIRIVDGISDVLSPCLDLPAKQKVVRYLNLLDTLETNACTCTLHTHTQIEPVLTGAME